MTYIPYDEFKKLKNNGDKSILKYFSFDDGTNKDEEEEKKNTNTENSKKIYYYTYTSTNGQVEFHENSYNIKTLTNMCSMPFNYLFALLQTTNDPEWVMSVVDQLLLESEAVLMIQDQKTTTETTETYSHMERQDITTEGEDGEPKVSIGSPYAVVSSNSNSIDIQYTSRVFISKANTWCLNYEQKGTLSTTVSSNREDYDSGNPGNYSYGNPITDGDVTTYTSSEEFLSSVTTTITSTTCKVDVIQEKEISDKFLSTWKNETGKYKLGAEYVKDGKEIKYTFPYRSKASSIPPDTLSEMSEYGIDLVLDLLHRHEDTQLQEQLMMYYWNEYTGEAIYDIDLEKLLEMFEAKISLKGSLLANFIMSHENPPLWNYITGRSSTVPSKYITSDGQNYIIYEDGSGGRHNVAFGMATYLVSNKYSACPACGKQGYYNWEKEFSEYGVDVKTLCSNPTAGKTNLVPVDAADSAFEDILQYCRDQVQDYIDKYIPGAELTSAQIDALTGIKYAFGNINGFDRVYKDCYKNGEWDYDKLKSSYFSVKGIGGYWRPFEEFGYYSPDWWKIFSEGIYLDTEGNVIQAGGGEWKPNPSGFTLGTFEKGRISF